MFYCNVKCKPWPEAKQLDHVTNEILLFQSEIWMDLFATLGLGLVFVLRVVTRMTNEIFRISCGGLCSTGLGKNKYLFT